jgi:hypothetical protein
VALKWSEMLLAVLIRECTQLFFTQNSNFDTIRKHPPGVHPAQRAKWRPRLHTQEVRLPISPSAGPEVRNSMRLCVHSRR